MAGHSQFKNIMHRKGAQDAKRAKIFAKYTRELTVASKTGGADPDTNPRLRSAIIAARSVNMPKDNIERAIKKGLGDGDAENFEEIRYEGYGPGGIAVMVETLTDNRNRTVSEIRYILSKNGGNLGESGCVAFLFDRMGEIYYPRSVATPEEMFETALTLGVDQVESEDDHHYLACLPSEFHNIRDTLEGLYGPATHAAILWKAKANVSLDTETKASIEKMLDALEDNDDVQNVFTNAELD